MPVEINNVSLCYCKTNNPLQRGYWQVLNGVPVGALELSEKQKEAIRKYMQASTCEKTTYQIAQEIGISSLTCSELHRTRKQRKKAYYETVGKFRKTLKQNETAITETELINFLKSKKAPVSASVCAKWLGIPVRAAFYRLQRLEQAGKVIKVKKNGFTQWTVTA